MISIMRPRGGGKTTKIVEICLANQDAVIVVANQMARKEMMARGIDRNQIITVDEVEGHRLRGRVVGPICIDDIDRILLEIFHVQNFTDFVISGTGIAL